MLYYFKAGDGREYGPISVEEIEDWKKQGRMNSESLVREENSDKWVSLGSVPELGSQSQPDQEAPAQQTQLPPQQEIQYKEHRGTMILVFGILGIACCFPFGIAAWILGNADLKQMEAGIMDPTGQGLTKGGKICGIISVVLNTLGILLSILVLLLEIAAN
jgi:hypothetical protein